MKPIGIFTLGMITGVLLWSCFGVILTIASSEDQRVVRGYHAIEFNMPRDQVVKLMRSEGRQSDRFYLGQRDGYEFEYAAAEKIGAAYFLSWITGIDHVFTVGFDKNNKAIFKSHGTT
jgi:hypothetical protein